MNSEVINIEESEAKVIGPRNAQTGSGDSSRLVILMPPSNKTEQIQQGAEVTYKGQQFTVATKGVTGTCRINHNFALTATLWL
jgi:predicted RecA/RadA family phage recombinase